MRLTAASVRQFASAITLCGAAGGCAVFEAPVANDAPPVGDDPQPVMTPLEGDQVSKGSGGRSSAGGEGSSQEHAGAESKDGSAGQSTLGQAPPDGGPVPPLASGGAGPGAPSTGPEDNGNPARPEQSPPTPVGPAPMPEQPAPLPPAPNPPPASAPSSAPEPTSGFPTTAVADLPQVPPDLSGLCKVDVVCKRAIKDEPKIDCGLTIHDVAGTLLYQGVAGVEQRGRSSELYPKRNYAIEFRTANGEDNPAGMLKMGKEADWILDGSWLDRSFMRNQLTSDLFAELSPTHFGAEGRFCTLTLNERKQGVYRLVEKIKRDDDRINITEDDGSGQSFVIKQDDEGTLTMPIRGGRSIKLGATWQAVYPKQDRALPAQLDGIQRWLNGLSDANSAGDGTLFSEYLDVTTTADWILFQELSKNIDGYDLSIYIFRDAGGLAHMVPWDFDLAYGHPTLQIEGNETPAGWIRHRSDFLQRVIATPGFVDTLAARWSVLRESVLTEESINAKFDSYLSVLSPESIAENFSLWPIEDVEFRQIYSLYSLYRVATHEAEVARLRQWIFDRLLWMDANLGSIIDAEDLPDRASRF